MITKGLKPAEIALLDAAGLAPDAVRAIAREAESLRWLFLKRPGATMMWWGLGVVAAVVIGGLFAATGWWGSLAAPALAAGSQLIISLADIEINAAKSEDPPRWAARKLAVLAIKARAMTVPENSEAFAELKAHAEAGSGLSSPWSVMRTIARRMEAPKGGAAAGSAARSRPADPHGVWPTLRFGLVVVAVVVIIVTLALGARPF